MVLQRTRGSDAGRLRVPASGVELEQRSVWLPALRGLPVRYGRHMKQFILNISLNWGFGVLGFWGFVEMCFGSAGSTPCTTRHAERC